MSVTVLEPDLERHYKLAALLLDCTCESLDRTAAGCPDRRCLVPGEEVEAINCCQHGGQLTVNVVNVFPSRTFPVPDVGSPSNCDAPFTVVTYGVQVLRCAPVGDLQRAPDCGALDDAALVTMTDTQAVRHGVTVCCLTRPDRVEPITGTGYRWTLGDHLTVGPQGGCAGSTLLVLVGYQTCWECG